MLYNLRSNKSITINRFTLKDEYLSFLQEQNKTNSIHELQDPCVVSHFILQQYPLHLIKREKRNFACTVLFSFSFF
jgi:hypothetical protein